MAPRNLTPLAIEQLKPGETRAELPDAKARGLYLIIHPSGKRRFCVRYRYAGKPRKLTLPTGLSLAAARAAAADAMVAVERGQDPAAAKKDAKAVAAAAAANTLASLAETYLRREEGKPAVKRLRTIGQRRAIFERIIYPALASRAVVTIKRSEVVSLLDAVEAKRGGRMADEVLSTLRILFDWHARRDDDFRSPIVKGMALTRPQDRIRNRVLADDEVVRVWKAAERMEGPFGKYVQFLLLTACRRNEAARMTFAEVKDGDWLIPAARYKTKAAHLIPLSAAAQAVLAKVPRIADCDFIFTTDGRRPISGFSAMKKKLDAAASVTGWTLHDVRRTARTVMGAAGVNPDHAERCLGHSLPGIRKTYDHHAFHAEKKAAFEMLAARIEHLIDPPSGNVVRLRKGRGADD